MTDDTHEIESLLGRYRLAGPSAALRSRIVQQSRRRFHWSFLEAMAALLLIGLNLAQISASVTPIISQPRVDEARTQEIVAAITRLGLPISPAEAQAMAQRLAAGEHLILLPLIHGPTAINPNYGAMP